MEEQGTLDIQAERKLDTVEEYKFEPIKGFPMLHWKGKRPFTSTQFYPAQLKENYSEEVNGWMNKLFWGDNLQVMSHLLKKYRGKIDLIYIDPPFDSNVDYKKRVTLKRKAVVSDINSFEEKQYSDIWANDDYLQFIFDRIVILRELLSDVGTIWLHCDYHKSHMLRCILDEVLGSENYVSEIIWKRSTPRGNVKRGLSTAHDTIHVYSKMSSPIWYPPKLDYSEEYKKRFTNKDEAGRQYTLDSLISPNPDRPNLDYEWNGVRKVWRTTKEKMAKLEEEGRIGYTSTGVARYKRYLDELEGMPLTTMWTDIDPVNSQASERENYPTQKPEKLLDRIIRTASKPNSIVLDAFMGSGTTQAVAMKLGRKFIGADINLGAIETTIKRLNGVSEEIKNKQPELEFNNENDEIPKATDLYTGFSVYNVNNYDVFRNPVEAKEILKQALEIQPLPNNTIYDGEKDGKMVKIMPVNRIATRADLNELISGFNIKSFEKRFESSPNKPVENLLLVCMGHEPDLSASLQKEMHPYKLDVEVIDILRDKSNLEFKRDLEAEVIVEEGNLIIKQFYPMNLLQKLSLMKENVEDWKELTESIKVDFNYDGVVFEPTIIDIPEKDVFVKGKYMIPEDAGTIRIKITDLLSESLELSIENN